MGSNNLSLAADDPSCDRRYLEAAAANDTEPFMPQIAQAILANEHLVEDGAKLMVVSSDLLKRLSKPQSHYYELGAGSFRALQTTLDYRLMAEFVIDQTLDVPTSELGISAVEGYLLKDTEVRGKLRNFMRRGLAQGDAALLRFSQALSDSKALLNSRPMEDVVEGYDTAIEAAKHYPEAQISPYILDRIRYTKQRFMDVSAVISASVPVLNQQNNT